MSFALKASVYNYMVGIQDEQEEMEVALEFGANNFFHGVDELE
ncbi:uncharacterized protein G2W53_021170 [Senna tora]|uniref:Uncharacterized protein n=1 Tax=Senna tora TaxID=362788 RepID=A0A834WKU9_9FABA|nr:uncharacterized protein G2W53_021170 [Senna tora]